MAAKVHPWLPLFFFLTLLSQSSSSPQNIQTFYPFPLTPPPPSPPPPSPPPPPPPPTPVFIPLLPPPPQPANNPPSSSTKGKVAKAVVATAAGTVFVSALFFFLLVRYTNKKKDKTVKPNPYSDPYPDIRREPREDFARFNSRVKGVIVDEDGLDVLYWKRLEGGEQVKTTFNKPFMVNNFVKDEEKRQSKKNGYLPIHERPLLRGMSSSSHLPDDPDEEVALPPPPPPPQPPIRSTSEISLSAMVVKESSPPPPPPPPQILSAPPPPPPKPPLAIQEKSQFSAIPKEAPQPAPLPPSIPKTSVPPPPPPRSKPPVSKPPPPPLPGSKPPPPPPRSAAAQASSSSSGTAIDSNGQVKMKPLHWDKVNPTNEEHSMVWHGLQKGSFKVDDDLMEALFGYVATNRKSPKRGESSSSIEKSNQSSQIFILDPRKSQNIAIVVRSLGISKRELVDSIIDGHGLNVETLERLTRIAPTHEEETAILQFNGDPEKLADAESFLYHLLKSIPTAFPRLNAMLFRSNYVPETLFLKESLQTLEKACKELRTRGLFLKLLEAILKAGNRMNAGTTRGNAQAFNLSALRKLSDVKSIDGKTTLLYFVVEEVVRAEGKRCLINKSRSISRTNSQSSQNSNISTTSNQDKEKEYIMLGLPVVGGLSSEFGTVKKSATMDYDTLSKTYPSLITRLNEIQQILDKIKKSGGDEGVGFAKEMKSFLELAGEELRVLKEEEEKVMELVKKTTDYYQTGNSKESEANPLHLFVIIKDFLGMVDQTCIEIARNMQKRRSVGSNDGAGGGLSTSKSPVVDVVDRRSVRFPKLPPNFMSEKSNGSDDGSSESDDDNDEHP
ncbi:formin-like protein 4 [Impatiens glandulifera]|uniref:formin-like protein 4 n=1 Tax=Impatiens glandulifera TaxID=253017 RepID=UPI001FB0D365|nr:formin-like protein 4 [Impatiens glandulifera]